MDRIEEEFTQILHRVYPETGKVIVAVAVVRGRVYFLAKSEVWLLRPGKRWASRLYRAFDPKDFRRLSRFVETFLRQATIHVALSERFDRHIPREQQSAAPHPSWPGDR